MIRIWPSALALLFLFGIYNAHAAVISGQVKDASTGQGLPAATLQVKGTYQGTISNDAGAYALKLERYPAVIRITYIGYQSQEIKIADSATTHLNITLEPAPVVLRETIVTTEDPAERIMRQVIRRKRQWRPRIKRFKAQAYSRWSMESDAKIVGIGEVVSEIYWDQQAGWREVVKSRHLSDNILVDRQKEDADFSFAESFFNLYDDEIEILNHQVIGPTHPDALKHYRFRLTGQRYLDDKIVYDITVQPKSKLQSAFKGKLAVLDEEFALLEAQLKPAKHIIEILPIPFLEITELSYKQQFRAFEGGVWLPVDFKSKAAGKLNMTLDQV